MNTENNRRNAGRDCLLVVKFVIPDRLPGLNEYITAERTNRYKGAAMKRQAEKIVIVAAKKLGKWRPDGQVRMVYSWFEPDRRRDKDNISSFGRKVIQDALVRGGWLKNDGWKEISGFEDRFFVDKKRIRGLKLKFGRKQHDSKRTGNNVEWA